MLCSDLVVFIDVSRLKADDELVAVSWVLIGREENEDNFVHNWADGSGL